MPKFRVFPTINIQLITKHILAMRQGSFYISQRRHCIFNNFTVKKNSDDDISFQKIIDDINNNVKSEKFAAAEKHQRFNT
jgi:hypothetical protein|tara:strand:+ start:21111 stop:21350 length:240 start_codon:yes stop_codon:yes gene_type:complete